MGFPTGYTELIVPKLFIQTLSLLNHLKNIILTLFTSLGIISQQNDTFFHPRIPQSPPVSALLIREFLPVINYTTDDVDTVMTTTGESCAVCLYEFKTGQEIRPLRCSHVFHRGCVDRWMDCEQTTCPLCRKEFLPEDMQEEFHQRLWDATVGIDDDDDDDDDDGHDGGDLFGM